MWRNALLLGLALWISRGAAVNYVFDEFLFSKDTWHLWKVDNPLADFNPSDLLPRAKDTFPGYEQSEFNSLDGPMSRLPPSARPTSAGLASDVEAIDDENMLEHAAKAAQCTTCHVLVSVVWGRLTSDVLSGEAVTPKHVREHLDDACEKDALDTMLKKYTIIKMESDGGSGAAGGGGGGTALLFFVVRERRGGAKAAGATDAEEAAVVMSCKTLVREAGRDLVSTLLEQLANYRREALRLLVKHGRDGGNEQEELPAGGSSSGSSGSGSSGQLPKLDGSGSSSGGVEEDDEYVDPDDLDEEGAELSADAKKAKKAATASKGGSGSSSGAKASGGAASGKPTQPRTVKGLVIKALPGEPECGDLHVKCPEWAASGECEVNPNYMIGTAGHRGHCRKSCGMCQPTELLTAAPALAADLESLGAALLLAVKNLGCGASGACLTGVSGMAFGAGIIKQQQQQPGATGAAGAAGGVQPVPGVGIQGVVGIGVGPNGKKELPPGMKEFPGGFILGKPWWGIPDVRAVPVAQRKPVPGLDGAASASASSAATSGAAGSSESGSAESGSGSASASGGEGGGTSQPPTHAEVDRVLAPALAHRVLSIPSDFFIYEYLYKNHTRHYHPDGDGRITEDWLLGKFSRESLSLISSATGEVAGLEELDLLPGGAHGERLKAHTWPYVKQVYAGGDECVLGGGRRVVRRVEARIACSPDSSVYMLIREPDFCTYTFVIYVPQLCELSYYRPRPKAGASGTAAGGSGGGGGGGAAAGSGGSAGSSSGTGSSSGSGSSSSGGSGGGSGGAKRRRGRT